jgi:hypothetical protein
MKRRPGVSLALLAGVGAALTAGLFLAASARTFAIGFPLDDAWIHQTYARNLVGLREWSFVPGQPSAGSTSPLWTLAMAAGRWLRLDPRAWAFTLGVLLLAVTGWLGARWIARRGDQAWGWGAALVVVLEWHLVWAGLSGMETIALACIVVAVFVSLGARPLPGFALGLVVGLGVWIRPDALTLLLPVAWVILTCSDTRPHQRWRSALLVGLGTLVLFLPYLAFNRLLAGEWWPSTFYAKQAEYAILSRDSLLVRVLREVLPPLAGVAAVLLPGMAMSIIHDIRAHRWERLAPWLWAAAFVFTYAWRLPATYQHGRYVMPVIPVIVLLGFEGMLLWLRGPTATAWRRITGRAWAVAVPAVAVIFLLLGARAYASDVAVIETEMVASARWIAGHTPPGSIIAAHDIGALGYFGGRPILDLAGLASPEVVPFIRDERRLADLMDERHAAYLMTFPGWYPILSANGKPVFTTHGAFSPAAGGENMVVYRWEDKAFARGLTAMLYSSPIVPR